MTPFFAFPAAFIAGAAAIAALVAIYVLRNRLPSLEVSSLFLWAEAPKTKEGGRKIKTLALPLLFFLELFALILLALAAATPFLPLATTARPLVIVLDDSFSMIAGDAESPRERALRFLDGDLEAGKISETHLILAGDTPTLAAEPDTSFDPTALGKVWTCGAPRSDLRSAMALAMEIGGPRARILVLTDHAADQALTSNRIVWRAFGEPRENLAFVSAVRSATLEKQRVQLEITNYGTRIASGSLHLSTPGGTPSETPLSLGAGETRRVALDLPLTDSAVEARLEGDSLDFDNRITLLAVRPRDVRVDLRIDDEDIAKAFEAALEATARVSVTQATPDLIVTDNAEANYRPGTWVVEIVRPARPLALGGPYLINSAHPLTGGISLSGIVWGAAKGTMPGTPVIAAGNTTLVTDEEDASDGHRIRIAFNPAMSTLQRTPAWPALVWNIVDWRGRSLAGFRDPNIRIGALARLTLPRDTDEVRIASPTGGTRTQAGGTGVVMVRASEQGVWTATAGDKTWSFASNPIAPDESNLSTAATGTWGTWSSTPEPGETNRDLAWIALLVLIAVLLGHQRLISTEAA